MIRQLAACIALLPAFAFGQGAYPSKPIRYVIPFAAGGPSDLMGRLLAKELAAEFGQPVVVENRPGATGIIGLDQVSASPPDGYTLLQLSNTTVVAHLFQNKPFDIDRQMTVIGNFHLGIPMLIVNPAKIPAKNVNELVQYLRANPGAEYTSSGNGSPGNLLVEAFALARGVKMTHVGYNGINPAMTDVVAGRVGLIVTDGLVSKPYLESGKLRALTVVASLRSTIAPDVPTSAEQGFPELRNDSLSGVIGPPGMPAAVSDLLRAAVRRGAAAEPLKNFFAGHGNVNKWIDGPEFRTLLIEDYQRWGKVIRDAGIKGGA